MTAATTTTGSGTRPAGPGADEPGLGHPQFWQREGAAAGASCASVAASTSTTTRRAGAARVAGTRPTPSPAGRASGCPPRPSGRRPPSWHPSHGRRSAVGRGSGQRARPTSASAARARPVERPPRREQARGCLGMIGDVWEWTVVGLHALPRLRGVALPRVLRGVLGRRVQGVARWLVGRPTRSPSAARSATGTTRSAVRSSPASAAPRTPDHVSPARLLGPPVPVADLVVDPPHSLLAPVHRRPRAVQRPREPRRLGHRLVRRRRPRPLPLPHRDADAARPRRRRRRSTGSSRAASSPTSGTSRPARRPRSPATRRSSSGRWLFAHNGFVEGYRDGVRERAARRSSPRPGRRRCTATPTARCCSGWCSIASTAARTRTTPSPR